jgi:hypothetical protein
MRSMGVMRALFVTARLMMLGSLAVVSSRMIEMLSGLGVVLCTLMFASHGIPHGFVLLDVSLGRQRPAFGFGKDRTRRSGSTRRP